MMSLFEKEPSNERGDGILNCKARILFVIAFVISLVAVEVHRNGTSDWLVTGLSLVDFIDSNSVKDIAQRLGSCVVRLL